MPWQVIHSQLKLSKLNANICSRTVMSNRVLWDDGNILGDMDH